MSKSKDLQNQFQKPKITDHAIVRYVERVIGIKREEFEERILTEQVVACINVFGSGKFPLEDTDRQVVVVDKVVVTIQ